jgi:hypothetical protein
MSLDVVDRLQQDVMRGFGAVPRRGAEIGGVLLGTVESGGGAVRVEEYEMVPIEYKRGPSYILSPEDVEAFDAALSELRSGPASGRQPVGYFRSHTRDGVGLGHEDLELLSRDFPQPEAVVLLIRPFGTKPSIAGFYFREKGSFQSGPPLLEFPFRRRDLAPDEVIPAQAPPERPRVIIPPRPRSDADRPPQPDAEQPGHQPPPASTPFKRPPLQYVRPGEGDAAVADPMDAFEASGFASKPPKTRYKPRRGLIWAPLSFIFLLIGILLGFQAAISMRPRAAGGAEPYNIALKVTQSGSDLQLTWDRQSLAIRSAQRGVLTIDDGAYNKPTNLAAGELQGGSVVIYRPVTTHVRFRLDLSMKDRDNLSETIEWKGP